MINLINQYSNGEKLYEKFVIPTCKEYGLTYMEFNIIMFLFNNPLYDTATQIIKYRHLTKSHVSISIKSLISKGLLTPKFENNDKKTIHLSLTDLTKPITKSGHDAQEKFFLAICEGFSKEEINKFVSFMKRIDINIEKFLN